MKFIADELIRNFAYAGQATIPSLVGGAREKPTRQKLETLLPPMVGVGSGCIIDTFGNTSKQMDIVLYEKSLCPVYSINDNPETTYYPCEGVIAVGEIKSSLNNKKLEDIFKKINSVKSLKRDATPKKSFFDGQDSVAYRNYGNSMSMIGTEAESFNQDTKITDQIFCFAFCGELGTLPETLLSKFVELMAIFPKQNLINLISILNHGQILYMNKKDNKYSFGLGDDVDSIYITAKRENNFQFLIDRLLEVIQTHRTISTSVYSKYTRNSSGQIFLDGTFKNI